MQSSMEDHGGSGQSLGAVTHKESAACVQGAGMVDELTTCWAMISLKRCAELVREMAISVPLYTGSIYEPVSERHCVAHICKL